MIKLILFLVILHIIYFLMNIDENTEKIRKIQEENKNKIKHIERR